MKFSTKRLAGFVAMAALVTTGSALAGGYGGGYGYQPQGMGMGYGPGGGYGAPYGRPPMAPPMRPQRPMPPPRPSMGQPYGYGAPMRAPYAGGYAPAQPAPAAAAPAPAGEAAENAEVAISGMRFGGGTVTIKAGGTVTWVNREAVPHTVTANDGSFGSENLGANASYSRTFEEPGTYNYYCKIHPTMRGTVVVEG